MHIEYEAKFVDIDKDEMRERLKRIDARLVRPEYFQKRTNFHLPGDKRSDHAWIRVRDEGDKITLSLKKFDGDGMHDQKEICLTIDDFENATKFLSEIGCEEKAYQETKRELWVIDEVEVTVDTWPHLEPFVEIEGKNEESVRIVAGKLGFDFSEAVFGGVGVLYKMKYGVAIEEINHKTKRFVFDQENPFLK